MHILFKCTWNDEIDKNIETLRFARVKNLRYGFPCGSLMFYKRESFKTSLLVIFKLIQVPAEIAFIGFCRLFW